MIDKLLKVGATFDWISPLLAEIQDVINGPSHTFLIDEHCGWSGRGIANLLRRRGIKTWGHMIVNGHIMITVREGQAAWAQHLLDQAGVPTITRFEKKTQKGRRGPASGWFDELADLLGLRMEGER